jgi:hypothetical protein
MGVNGEVIKFTKSVFTGLADHLVISLLSSFTNGLVAHFIGNCLYSLLNDTLYELGALLPV